MCLHFKNVHKEKIKVISARELYYSSTSTTAFRLKHEIGFMNLSSIIFCMKNMDFVINSYHDILKFGLGKENLIVP